MYPGFEVDGVSITLIVTSCLITSLYIEVNVRRATEDLWYAQASEILRQAHSNASVVQALEGYSERQIARARRANKVSAFGYITALLSLVVMAATYTTTLARSPYWSGGGFGLGGGPVTGVWSTVGYWLMQVMLWGLSLGLTLMVTGAVARLVVQLVENRRNGPMLPVTTCPACRLPCGDAWACSKCGEALPNLPGYRRPPDGVVWVERPGD